MKRIFIIGLAVALVVAAVFSVALAKRGAQAWLGVYTQEVDRDLAREFDLPVEYGAIINEVVEESPAEKAGLREDDIIIAINGDKIRDDDDLLDFIEASQPDSNITITVMRGEEKKDLVVKLDSKRRYRQSLDYYFDRDERWRAPRVPPVPDVPGLPGFYYDFDTDARGYIGVGLVEVSEEVTAALGAGDHGVLIDGVEKSSPADKAGLKAGDIVVAIDGEKVFDAADVSKIIGGFSEGDSVQVEVVRERSPLKVAVEVGQEDEYGYGGHRILRAPDLPRLDLDAPRTRGLYRSLDSDDYREATEEYRREMEKLSRELDQLRKELEELKSRD